MGKPRIHRWIAFLLSAVALFLFVILGLRVYMSTTAKSLHPDPLAAPSVAGAAPPSHWRAAVEESRRLVRAHLSSKNLPGLSVAVGIDGNLVWAEGFGFANLEDRLPVTPESRFRIGTASTVLTSAAAGLLIEKSRLKLDDAIQTYVPEFPQKQWPVTARQLMGHLAGLRNDGGDEGPLFAQTCAHPADALPHFANASLLFEPGTQFHYSSYGWILISAAIEAAARQPFLDFVQQSVFQPLGMKDTVPASVEPPPDEVTPYFPRFAADPAYGLHLMRSIELSCYAGAGAFVSTPSDMVRFGMAIEGGQLLQPATVQLLQTSQRLASGAETGYGLGWDLETIDMNGKPTATSGHDGDVLGGMVASLLTVPGQRIVVAVMSNISYAATFPLASQIAQAFGGQPASRVPPAP